MSETQPRAPLPPLDFSGFVLSLASSAMIHLGQVHGPDGGHAPLDLPAAKQVIEILALLEAKTRGNLEVGEDKLIKSLLFDLRVQFVDAEKLQHARR